jgi:hypothetical protein
MNFSLGRERGVCGILGELRYANPASCIGSTRIRKGVQRTQFRQSNLPEDFFQE